MKLLVFGLTLLIGVTVTQAQDQLVLISPHWEGIQVEFERAFKDHYRKTTKRTVTFKWVSVGGTMAILRYIRTGFKKTPDGITIDLMWGGGLDPFLQLKREGLLQPVKLSPAVLQKLPKTAAGVPIYDPQGYWFGAALSGFGIIFNKTVLKTLKLKPPKTWEDLGDPKFFGWIEVPDPRRSGSAHMMCEIILQAYGWEKGWEVLTRIFANAKRITPGSEEPVSDVANGEVACAPSIDFYAWAKIAEAGSEVLGFVYPPKLTVINPDSIGMLKGAPNRKVAQAFIEFVLSEQGQKLWMLPLGATEGPKKFTLARMGVLPNLYEQLGEQSVVKVNPFRFKPGLRYDAVKGDKRIDVLNSLMGALLIDTHRELKGTWQQLIKFGTPPKSVLKQLCHVPISETETMKLAEKWASERVLAAKLESEWVSFAKQKYAKLAK